MEWFWLMLFAIFLFLEATTFNLITIWFAVGALGAFIVSYFTNDFLIQCLIFTLTAMITLILTKPLVKKLLKGHEKVKTNLDSVIGKIGIVEVEIKPNSIGRVEVAGKDWAAKSDKMIKKGRKVEVLAIEGVKLIVKERGK